MTLLIGRWVHVRFFGKLVGFGAGDSRFTLPYVLSRMNQAHLLGDDPMLPLKTSDSLLNGSRNSFLCRWASVVEVMPGLVSRLLPPRTTGTSASIFQNEKSFFFFRHKCYSLSTAAKLPKSHMSKRSQIYLVDQCSRGRICGPNLWACN
jgi:hypothetical protein